MIPRTRPPKLSPPSVPEIESVATTPVAHTDLDVCFGPGDVAAFTLGPDDTFEATGTVFVICLKENDERVEIDRSKVRWWSRRTRIVHVPLSLDPADQQP